ncbi:hypothetical protein F9L16_15965 [Agarivorans sp. B2Z047]|uniref:hypothetical protein n=1 Tax=Agarivorans sp. B2Z047 TaxID=2652721 RepID=UPI00128C629D|nr:hypothetical protein [Agarivorans sp. B2Z047]MPW30483.1 hypothetical protein [Agarivorans sp. B2Z047]UQN42297.1 hypothetical protein LQZ07_21380 [Agarivorans sp. B2Z047]
MSTIFDQQTAFSTIRGFTDSDDVSKALLVEQITGERVLSFEIRYEGAPVIEGVALDVESTTALTEEIDDWLRGKVNSEPAQNRILCEDSDSWRTVYHDIQSQTLNVLVLDMNTSVAAPFLGFDMFNAQNAEDDYGRAVLLSAAEAQKLCEELCLWLEQISEQEEAPLEI